MFERFESRGGYGDSSKPTTNDHQAYSKRAMARDQVAVMRTLGYERFAVAGRDRGGYCAYRLALDHPQSIERLAVLDIIPAGEAWRRANSRFMLSWWHWAFLAQRQPLPERLLEQNPGAFYFRGGTDAFQDEALAAYRRATRDPETIHAMCEDYRANATYDRTADDADRAEGRRISCPVLALWGRHDDLEDLYGDPLRIWEAWCNEVSGRGLDCGHYLLEEAPEETAAELGAFFAGHDVA
ncbi:MAG: alpha/beta fold hydrolase [Actinomycetota bacterium]